MGLALLLCGSPALAGISLINGGGAGGIFGSASSSTTGLTSPAITVDIPPGSLVVAVASISANAAFTCPNDSAGNSYTAVGAQSSSAISIYYCYGMTTSDLPIGSTFTVNSSSASSKTIVVTAWAGVDASSPLDTSSPGGTVGTGTAISVGPSGTWSCPGGTNCSLQIGAYAFRSTFSNTEDVAFTSMFTNGSLPGPHIGYRIASSTSPTTYAPTASASAAWAGLLKGFKANGALQATRPCMRSLLGVGC